MICCGNHRKSVVGSYKYSALRAHGRIDPTKTAGIRRSFVAEMVRRFKAIRKDIIISMYKNDCFNIGKSEVFSLQQIIFNTPAQKAQFDFPQNRDKVKAFMEWLKQQEKEQLLTVSKVHGRQVANQESWMDYYLESAYKRGIQNAQNGMDKKGVQYVKRSINTAFNRPVHVDRVGLLYTRAFNSLKGITDEMDKQISSILAQGLVDGLNPFVLARQIVDRVDKIGITRARMLARTEVIRAHSEATLNEFEEANLDDVEVLAEWLTGGFDVCPICEGLQGQTFHIKEAHGMIPAHPNCKCTWIPSLP